MVGSPETAEELTQDVFLRVLKGLDSYQERDHERAWLFRIARNLRCDHLRQRQRQPRSAPLEDIHAVEPQRQELQFSLARALAALADDDREAFVLGEIVGFSYVEMHGKTLEWDLWLSGAQSGPAHRALTSPQGESAAFQFDPIPASAVQPGRKADGATIHVYGQLRGRVRADGNIDVALTAVRYVTSDQNRSRLPRSLNPISNSGQKNFVVSPGEAIKIVLPPINPAPPVRSAQSAFAPPANDMSITVQARVR